MEIVLSGEPKSTQHIYGIVCRGRFPSRYMTAQGKALKQAYQWEAKSQWKGKPLTGSVSADITLYFGTRRKSDLDNFHKLSLDALSGIAYGDDGQIDELRVKRGYDKLKPRIEVSLVSLQRIDNV